MRNKPYVITVLFIMLIALLALGAYALATTLLGEENPLQSIVVSVLLLVFHIAAFWRFKLLEKKSK